jgi:hypothetical protein
MPVAPSGLLTLGRVSQGEPWAKFSWPFGPKTRYQLRRAFGKCPNSRARHEVPGWVRRDAFYPRPKNALAFSKQIPLTKLPSRPSSFGISPRSTSDPNKLQRMRRKYSWRG